MAGTCAHLSTGDDHISLHHCGDAVVLRRLPNSVGYPQACGAGGLSDEDSQANSPESLSGHQRSAPSGRVGTLGEPHARGRKSSPTSRGLLREHSRLSLLSFLELSQCGGRDAVLCVRVTDRAVRQKEG
jgi:hypothetical protein